MLQLTHLVNNGVNITYSYSPTQNNGKITSQTDNISGEQLVYAYDALNRLASAQATNNSWGQSYNYDGFGNLTDQNVIAGSAPTYHVVFDPTTNRVTGDCADANGNEGACAWPSGTTAYDIENRLVGSTNAGFAYSYAPGNKRVWRGICCTTDPSTGNQVYSTDEVTFWIVLRPEAGDISTVGRVIDWRDADRHLVLLRRQDDQEPSGYVGADRLGSIGNTIPMGRNGPRQPRTAPRSLLATCATRRPGWIMPISDITLRGRVGS